MARRFFNRGASPLGLPYTVARGAPSPRSAPVARSLRSLVSFFAGWCLVLATFLALSLSAQAPGPSDQTAADAAKRAAERIGALQKESEALALQERTLLVELRKLEVDRELKTEELTNAERELRHTREKIAATSARAATLKNTAETQRPEVERRMVDLYKMGQAGYWRLLLDVDNLRSIGRVYRTAAALNRLDRERVQQHERTLQLLKRERETLETHVREVTKLQQQALAAKTAIDRAVAARTALVNSIDQRRDLNAQLTGELEAAQQRLQGTVAQLAGHTGPVMLPLAPFRGVLVWPAQGIVTGRFGRQTNSRFGTSIARSGIEISIAEGQPVRAIHEGTVAYSDQFTGYGNLVIIDHGDSNYSLYGYLSSIEAPRGTHVDAQAQLGTSGRDPSGNPALYFELRIDGKPVDPLQWLKK